ncbi:MAG: flagellar biosynthesis protein [Planctomycetes bacterium]|nr:flagellar biosynthesis protein [Planctomycetota bacterium]
MSDASNLLKLLEPSVRPAGAPSPIARAKTPVHQQSFAQMLDNAASAGSQPLKLSSHARQRLNERGVELSDAQMQALSAAADKAEAKGSRDALMMMNQLGLIVNIPNRTVLTAIDADRMRDGVVTQIDSAMMVDDPTARPTPSGSHRLKL